MKKIIGIVLGLVLLAGSAHAQSSGSPFGGFGVGASGGSSTQTNIYPGAGFSAGANPNAIIPRSTGKIFYVDGNSGNDANACTSPAAACLTITHGISLATDDAGDVVVVFPKANGGNYAENVVVNKRAMSLISSAVFGLDEGGIPPSIDAGTGIGMDITARDTYVNGFFVEADDGINPAIKLEAQGGVLDHFQTLSSQDGIDITAPATYLTIRNGMVAFSSAFGISIANNGASQSVLDNVIFGNNTSADISATGTAFSSNSVIKNCQFAAPDKAIYITINATPQLVLTNNSFNVTKPLTTTQVSLPSTATMQGNWPNGDIGTDAGIAPKTFTSSAVVSAGVTGFTASGTLYCNQINLETNSTGLAAGTNFTVTSNSSFGLAVICSETVANLGVSKSKPCSAASVTPLVPFTLLDGNTLTLKCTGTDCTGAGTIKVTPVCTRRTMYAGAL